MATTNEPRYLNTMSAAARYGVSTEMLRHWTRWQGFNADWRKRDGQNMLWNVNQIDAWLRSRPVSKRGARPRWLEVVGHKAA